MTQPPPEPINFNRFKDLTYEDYRALARDPALSEFEKVGFPDAYREGKGAIIFAEIRSRLTQLDGHGKTVVDIGPGCSDPARLMIAHCQAHGHTLILIDAPEMLDLLPDGPGIIKLPARYPVDCPDLFRNYASKVDVVCAYGVVPVIFAEGLLYPFLDQTIGLLASGAQWLIGDIPNVSKRKRFFASETGVAFHKQFMNTDQPPEVHFNTPEPGQFDDALITGMILRLRAAGLDAYWLPQRPDAPMANRREDVLILKP